MTLSDMTALASSFFHIIQYSLSVSYTPYEIIIILVIIVVVAIIEIDNPRITTIIGIRAKLMLHLILFCKNVTKAFDNTLWQKHHTVKLAHSQNDKAFCNSGLPHGHSTLAS
jgi:hypothetical protein